MTKYSVESFKRFLLILKEEGKEYEVDINIGTKVRLYSNVKTFWESKKVVKGVSLPQVVSITDIVDFTVIAHLEESMKRVQDRILGELQNYDYVFLDGLWGNTIDDERGLTPQYIKEVAVIDTVIKFLE